MSACDCCGCVFESDYGTSIIVGSGSKTDPYVVSVVDAAWVRPAARVQRTSVQSIPTGAAFTAISFNLESFDQGGNFWVASAPTLLTIPLDGLYIFGGCGIWSANTTGTRELGFRRNGSTILQVNDQPVDTANGSSTSWGHVSYQFPLGAGDTLELVARQESGVSINLNAETDSSIIFWIVYVGRKN